LTIVVSEKKKSNENKQVEYGSPNMRNTMIENGEEYVYPDSTVFIANEANSSSSKPGVLNSIEFDDIATPNAIDAKPKKATREKKKGAVVVKRVEP